MYTRERSRFFCALAVVLALVVGAYFVIPAASGRARRAGTVDITQLSIEQQTVLQEFDEPNLVVENNVASFSGYQQFDMSLLNGVELVSSNLGAKEEQTVKYEVTVNAEDGTVRLDATLDRGDGKPLVDTIYGMAVNDDVMFVIDGNIVRLSDFQNTESLNNVGWFSNLFKKIVKAVVTALAPVLSVVAAVLSNSVLGIVNQVTAEANYKHNLKQDIDIAKDGEEQGFIDNQFQFDTWKYGLTTMDKNGCGAIATYNTMLHFRKFSNQSNKDGLGNVGALSKIVRDYEAYHGTIAFGFGGTNPTHIAPYLMKQNIITAPYAGRPAEQLFYNRCNTITYNQAIILAFWWQKSGEGIGAHFVTVIKNRNGNGYIVLNEVNATVISSVRDFMTNPLGGYTHGFIQGWVVG